MLFLVTPLLWAVRLWWANKGQGLSVNKATACHWLFLITKPVPLSKYSFWEQISFSHTIKTHDWALLINHSFKKKKELGFKWKDDIFCVLMLYPPSNTVHAVKHTRAQLWD